MTHSTRPRPAPGGVLPWMLRGLLLGVALSLIAGCGGGGSGTAGGGDAAAAGPPALVEGPQPVSVKAGEAARFGVVASGAGLSYQWQRDGSDVPGAVQAGYMLASAQAADHGSRWSVRVSGAGGSVTSAAARLSVLAITVPPASQQATAGAAVAFDVQATGDDLRYQWQRNGADVAGAVQARLALPAVQAADDGSRWAVRVSNAAGTLASAEALLSVRQASASELRRVAGWLAGPGFADGPGVDARFDRPAAIARDAAGALWVGDQGGLALRKVGSDGSVVTVVGRRSPRGAALLDEQGRNVVFGALAVAPDGRAYAIGASSVLYEVSPAGAVSTRWRGEWGFADGPLAGARFGTLKAIAADRQGRLHVADADGCAVRTIDLGSATVSTRARTLPCSNGSDPLSLWGMTALALHASGDLVAVAGQRLLRVSPAGAVSVAYEVTTPFLALGPTLVSGPDGSVYATAADTRLQRPAVLRLGADGRMSAVEAASASMGSGRLFVVADDGALLFFDNDAALWSAAASPAVPRLLAGREAALAGRPVNGPFVVDAGGGLVAVTGTVVGQQSLMRVASDGQAALIDLDTPVPLVWVALAAGADGGVVLLARPPAPQFVISGSGPAAPGQVYRISAAGQVQGLAGSSAYLEAADGLGAAAHFEYPQGLAADGGGNLYLIDRQWSTFTARIRRIAPDGTVSTRPGAVALNDAHLAVDGSGHVYTASPYDPRVRRLSPAGELTVVFGDTLAAEADGPTGVTGLAVEPDGTLLVAHNDGLIRRVGPAGQVTVLAGTAGVHGVRLAPLPATVNAPSNLTLDGGGRLYLRSEQAVLVLP